MTVKQKTTTLSSAQHLRNSGLRPSQQRLAVFNYLCDHKTHPTVDMVYHELLPIYPTLSRTTVYQTLEALCENGLALKLTIEENVMRFDADTSGHGHFLCTGCGNVFDFFYSEKTSFPKPNAGFVVEQTHLYQKGRCPKCSVKKVRN